MTGIFQECYSYIHVIIFSLIYKTHSKFPLAILVKKWLNCMDHEIDTSTVLALHSG